MSDPTNVENLGSRNWDGMHLGNAETAERNDPAAVGRNESAVIGNQEPVENPEVRKDPSFRGVGNRFSGRLGKGILLGVAAAVVVGGYLGGSAGVIGRAKKADVKLPEKMALEVGESADITFSVYPDSVELTFASDDAAVAAVEGETVTARASGDTTVTASWSVRGFFRFGVRLLGGQRQETFPVHIHGYENLTTVPADCTREGTSTAACACGKQQTEVLPALGHDYKAAETKESCTEAGETVFACTRCGDTYSKETAALGHNYKTTETKATCTAEGKTVYTCAVCGDSYTETAPAVGHKYQKTSETAATCTEDGKTVYTCSVCGDKRTETAPATGHSYRKSSETKATCTAEGKTVYTCAVCGDSYSETTPAVGHQYQKTSETKATCTAGGKTVYTCSVCGSSYSESTGSLGHDYSIVTDMIYDDEYHTCTCSRCGAKTKEKHSYDNYGYCTVCGHNWIVY